MLSLLAVLVSTCLADPTHLYEPAPEQVKFMADRYQAIWRTVHRELATTQATYHAVLQSSPPTQQPDGLNPDIFRQRAAREREELQIYLRRQLEAGAEMIKQMRATLLPPLRLPLSSTSGVLPAGTIGALSKPVRIVRVLDGESLLIAAGDEEVAARVQCPTDGLENERELQTERSDLYIVVGTYQYVAEQRTHTVPDLRQLDTAPVKAEVQKRLSSKTKTTSKTKTSRGESPHSSGGPVMPPIP